jgi:hypothetical protein
METVLRMGAAPNLEIDEQTAVHICVYKLAVQRLALGSDAIHVYGAVVGGPSVCHQFCVTIGDPVSKHHLRYRRPCTPLHEEYLSLLYTFAYLYRFVSNDRFPKPDSLRTVNSF